MSDRRYPPNRYVHKCSDDCDCAKDEPAQLTLDGREEPLDEGPVSEPTSGCESDGAVSGPSPSGAKVRRCHSRLHAQPCYHGSCAACGKTLTAFDFSEDACRDVALRALSEHTCPPRRYDPRTAEIPY